MVLVSELKWHLPHSFIFSLSLSRLVKLRILCAYMGGYWLLSALWHGEQTFTSSHILGFLLLSFSLLPYFSPVYDTEKIDKASVNVITTMYQFCRCKGRLIVTVETSACCISLGRSSILIGRVQHWFVFYWEEWALVLITQTWCSARKKLGRRLAWLWECMYSRCVCDFWGSWTRSRCERGIVSVRGCIQEMNISFN